MNGNAALTGLELMSLMRSSGEVELWLEERSVPDPAPDEVVIRVEAAPINPSDLGVLFGPADLGAMQARGTAERPVLIAPIAATQLARVRARLDIPSVAGNEGAGVVVRAGSDAQALLGRIVATRTFGMYAHYRVARVADCMIVPPDTSAREAASAFINPLTVLGMVETMRREGHTALVHTAAASSVGQMLNRLCIADGIPLVNIVRTAAQVQLLRAAGATYVLDSTVETFVDDLTAALSETGATLAFDAISGGTLAATILSCMEAAALRKATTYNRYGSPIHKQVYTYGVLDPRPIEIAQNFGMAWGLGGWLMTWFMQKIGPADAQRLRDRVAGELKTTFASHYTAEISLRDALLPATVASYGKAATGEKYVITPN